ncbi:MAG: MBL fold metallo-hydrolase [Clostridia bacterium]|nr:MBL fold metallo-hydrolase [Clostridia bacterium]
MRESISIRWLGHAAYKITKGNYSVVLDPFAPGTVPGFRDICEEANLVLCSHGHHDHNHTEAVTLLPETEPAFAVTTLSSFHDDVQGAKRGPNTIHILEADGVRIVHFGDLGCALTPEQIETLRGADVILIPVGGFYTIDAAQAKAVVDQIRPKVVIPMHYKAENYGLAPIGTVEEFLALFADHVQLGKDTFTVGEVDAGVVVLSY